ncbi:MAG: transcription-repair coupling factor, partial [Coriobacteriaceae bacterium]|nr:transcription-repair coupling factor [Coriobacteriaceae bacterium]
GLHFDGDGALLPLLYPSTTTLGSYLGAEVLTVQLEPRSLIDDATHAYDEIKSRAQGSSLALEGLYALPSEVDFGSNQRATYVSIMQVGGQTDDELPVKRVEVAGKEEKLFGKLRSLVDGGYTVVFSVPSFRARRDMKFELVDRGLSFVEVLESVSDVSESDVSESDVSEAPRADKLKHGVINIVDVEIPLGMIIPKARLALVSIADTRSASVVRKSRRIDITEITFPYKPGDYVVHAVHGIAFFKELIRREIDNVARDYLLLEYAQNDKLYVPVEQLDRVTRYVGADGASPRLTRLNTADWSRALGKAQKATKQLAFDLVDIYARRSATQGYRYAADSFSQKEMEEAFPYQETPDQLAAIADVKADMQSAKPMDRLICGDVGFGKTEVALRAAFKATQDLKQVMVLCPTTILAQQHFTNFKDRFDPFGVQVDILSRFRSDAQQKVTLEAFSRGEVQVLIGTHRLLSRDVNPHDLGLVVIDEEQRFGVGHKEQLKNLRESIDILTLSATPIPRTMQMSLSGVRDMSLILTPPDDRRPVEVHVGEWDPDVVSGALRRELARGGQVYYVSNRVRSLDEALERVAEAAAEARVGVAHGQMSKDSLERVMEDFSAGELDVLVATTIIESGIDNPHTNTLIIEDSHRLGLAQLYQLKGRVGRSSTQAFAYFMFPEHLALTEEASARLTAVNEHSDLGSGMRIALRDLEIRGAGSLLGAEQSGNMSAVGFDLFASMLAQAVSATREGDEKALASLPPALSDISINIPAHTYLPEEYIGDADERVLVYRRIASADTLEAVEELFASTLAGQGEMPQAAKNFFMKARCKALANEKRIKTISVVGGKLTIEPIELEASQVSALRRLGARYVDTTNKLVMPVRCFKLDDDTTILDAIFAFLQELTN